MPLVRPPRFDEWLACYFAPYDNVDSPWQRFPVGGGRVLQISMGLTQSLLNSLRIPCCRRALN